VSKLALFGGNKVREAAYPPYPVLSDDEKREIISVIESNILSGFIASDGDAFFGGPRVRELEGLIKEYFGVKHAIAVNSCTAALNCATAALGLGPGDEVLVPPLTMSATATSVLMTNAVPVFVDIDPDRYSIDPRVLERSITAHTRAIIVVHLFGYPANMDDIMAIAGKHGLRVIEDCAQAPGAKYKGKLVGTLGDIGVFSLNQHKTITTGEGGWIVTDDDILAKKMQLVRNHGEVIVDKMPEITDVSNMIGYNYRMPELEAAVGVAQFVKLDKFTEGRIELAQYLQNRLKHLPGLQFPSIEKDSSHVYFALPIKIDPDLVGITRDQFVDALVAEGIPFGKGYVRPIYWEPTYQKQIGYGTLGCPFKCPLYKGSADYSKGICPVAEDLHMRTLMNSSPAIFRAPMTRDDMDDIVRAFEKIYECSDEFKK
jgi:dTDP-4-amino-4,6-dideoxygalactose transaminase